MTEDNIREMIIIGSGPAGLTAAIYAARADLAPLLFAGEIWGGQLMNTTEVENFPGFKEGIQGPELMNEMLQQAKRFGTDVKFNTVTDVEFEDDIKKVYVGKVEYKTKSIIIATGSSPRRLGLASEDKFWGKGVSSCATCDGAFYKDKPIAVVGGGDSAMEEANFLTKFASKVYIIHRRDEFRASQIMQERVFNNDKVEIIWDSEVEEVLGEDKVTGLRIINNKTEEETNLDVDGLFLAIGHIPNTKFLEGKVDMDNQGYLLVHDKTYSSEDGVFIAGDVKDHRYQQAVTAAGMGCMAALDAEKWLEANE